VAKRLLQLAQRVRRDAVRLKFVERIADLRPSLLMDYRG